MFEEEKLKSSGIQASDSTLHNLECYRLMYPLQVQNLLPLNLTLKEGRGGEERNIRPGEVVNFNAVNMDLQPNFEIVVRGGREGEGQGGREGQGGMEGGTRQGRDEKGQECIVLRL